MSMGYADDGRPITIDSVTGDLIYDDEQGGVYQYAEGHDSSSYALAHDVDGYLDSSDLRNGSYSAGFFGTYGSSTDDAFNSYLYTSALQRQAQDFNAAEAQKARDYDREMSNSVYQRTINDLKAAGLNPILAFQNSALSGNSYKSTTAASSSSGSVNQSFGNSGSGSLGVIIGTALKVLLAAA